MNATDDIPVIFTPDNEPYLGLGTLRAFDDAIVTCLKVNSRIAPMTSELQLNDLQRAACQLIPAGINLALSLRELLRQGYLYGAAVMIRPLAERAVTILYLKQFPDKLTIWHDDGWHYRKRPTLAKMLDEIGGAEFPNCGREVTNALNSLTHGDPESSKWNIIATGDDTVGYAVSKMLDRPDICSSVALDGATWLSVILGMMPTIFPLPDSA